MARKEEQRTIDGKEYTFYQLSPKKSVKTLFKLMKIVGPSLGALAGSAKGVKTVGGLLDADIDLSKILDALFDKFDEDGAWEIIEEVLSQTTCAGVVGSINIETHFKGDIQHLFKVAIEAIKVEYGDFFAGKFGIAAQGVEPDSNPKS